MPNKQVYNQQAEDLKVTIHGQNPNNAALIDRNGNLLITGLLSVTSTDAINVSGLTIGTAVIANTMSVRIPGIISVSVVNTPSVRGTLSFSGNPTFILGGIGFTQRSITISLTGTLLTALSTTTSTIDVGSLTKYGYYVQTPASAAQVVSVRQQISYTTQNSSFVNAPEAAVNVPPGGSALVTGKYLQYSRLFLSWPAALGSGGVITAIFQGQV